MTDQSDPVTADEVVFRRVAGNPSQYNPALEIPVTPGAFNPSDQDVDGLSVFRALFTTPEEISSSGRKPNSYYVVRLLVGDIHALGLNVVADPREDQPPGHALIRELNKYTKRTRLKELRLALAKLASKSVVLSPRSVVQ